MPLAGILFLDWQPWFLLTLYYVDTMAHLGGGMLLAHLEREYPKDNTLKVIFGICGFGAIMGFPVLMVAGSQFHLSNPLLLAWLVQAGMSFASLAKMRRESHERDIRQLAVELQQQHVHRITPSPVGQDGWTRARLSRVHRDNPDCPEPAKPRIYFAPP